MAAASSTPSDTSINPVRYDRATLVLHWLTVLAVVVLFGTSLVWNYVTPRDRFWRPLMEQTHVSIGIAFAVLIVLRIVWRLTGARRIAPEAGLSGLLSRAMSAILYLLIVAQVGLGFTLRWVQGEEFSFFGLFSIPALVGENSALEHPIENFHNWVGWTIVILSFGHAGMALIHHYVLKDDVLGRMLWWGPKKERSAG